MKEYFLRCDHCPMERVSLRRPTVGAFHWSVAGRCCETPELLEREVSEWNPVPLRAGSGESAEPARAGNR